MLHSLREERATWVTYTGTSVSAWPRGCCPSPLVETEPENKNLSAIRSADSIWGLGTLSVDADVPYTLSSNTYSFLWCGCTSSHHAQVGQGHKHPQETSKKWTDWQHEAIISAFARLRQEDAELEKSMGHTVQCCLKNKCIEEAVHAETAIWEGVAGPNCAALG